MNRNTGVTDGSALISRGHVPRTPPPAPAAPTKRKTLWDFSHPFFFYLFLGNIIFFASVDKGDRG